MIIAENNRSAFLIFNSGFLRGLKIIKNYVIVKDEVILLVMI